MSTQRQYDIDFRESNARLIQMVQSGLEKQAQDELSDFTRTYVLQLGDTRKILPPEPVEGHEFDRRVEDDKPFIVIDKEPGMPMAMTAPLATLPTTHYIRGPRWRLTFARIFSPRFIKEVLELATWRMDIRQIIADKIVKVVQYEEDLSFFTAINSLLSVPDAPITGIGVPLYRQFRGGLTRTNWVESTKLMPATKFHLEPSVAIMNTLTYRELLKWGREEWGGDFAQQIIREGTIVNQLDGIDLQLSINHEIIPTGTVYFFAEPRFLGKFKVADDITMFVKSHMGYIIEFCAHEAIGIGIGHTGALARADFV
jgi:hypothetical protein